MRKVSYNTTQDFAAVFIAAALWCHRQIYVNNNQILAFPTSGHGPSQSLMGGLLDIATLEVTKSVEDAWRMCSWYRKKLSLARSDIMATAALDTGFKNVVHTRLWKHVESSVKSGKSIKLTIPNDVSASTLCNPLQISASS